MVLLTIVFAALGSWQVQRLAEKESLLARVEARVDDIPGEPPPLADWGSLREDEIEYAPLALSGHYRLDHTIRVFTSLARGTARGDASGAGYWLVDPFVLEEGGTVFVNRGFVPMGADPIPPPAGWQRIEGLARSSEPVGSFTPQADQAERIEWVRNVNRLADLAGEVPAPVAPFTLDVFADPAGGLPQGGETVLEFPNNHLGYAITWFGFALITPILLVAWLWRGRRDRSQTLP